MYWTQVIQKRSAVPLGLAAIQNRKGKMSGPAVNTVLIDLSGTLHIDDTEIPGSVEALERFDF